MTAVLTRPHRIAVRLLKAPVIPVLLCCFGFWWAVILLYVWTGFWLHSLPPISKQSRGLLLQIGLGIVIPLLLMFFAGNNPFVTRILLIGGAVVVLYHVFEFLDSKKN